jgi:hypothetical protein
VVAAFRAAGFLLTFFIADAGIINACTSLRTQLQCAQRCGADAQMGSTLSCPPTPLTILCAADLYQTLFCRKAGRYLKLCWSIGAKHLGTERNSDSRNNASGASTTHLQHSTALSITAQKQHINS